MSGLEPLQCRARSSASRRAPWSLHRAGTAPHMSVAMRPTSITVTKRTRSNERQGQLDALRTVPSSRYELGVRRQSGHGCPQPVPAQSPEARKLLMLPGRSSRCMPRWVQLGGTASLNSLRRIGMQLKTNRTCNCRDHTLAGPHLGMNWVQEGASSPGPTAFRHRQRQHNFDDARP